MTKLQIQVIIEVMPASVVPLAMFPIVPLKLQSAIILPPLLILFRAVPLSRICVHAHVYAYGRANFPTFLCVEEATKLKNI